MTAHRSWLVFDSARCRINSDTPHHRILEQLPEGRWTSYEELADAIGAAPQPLGEHISGCRHCVNAWRILTADGQVAPTFRWSDPNDTRDPRDVLEQEGIAFIDDKANPDRQLGGDELVDLTEARTS